MNPAFKIWTVPIILAAGLMMGFLTEILIAGLFGTDAQVGLYRLAISVPALLSFTVGSAIVTAFVSELITAEADGPRAFSSVNRFIKQMNLSFVWICLAIGLLTKSWQVELLAPGLQPPEQADLNMHLTLSWLLFGLVGHTFLIRARMTVAGVLWVNSAVTLIRYSVFLLSLLILVWVFPQGDHILAVAYAISGCGVLVMHLAMNSRVPQPTAPTDSLSSDQKSRICFSVLTVVGFQILASLTTIIDRSIVSYSGAEAVAAFDYSIIIITAVGSIFTSFGSIVILPRIMRRNLTVSGATENRLWYLIALFFTLASVTSILLTVFSAEIAALILERGAFSAEDTAYSTSFLVWHASGLFFLICNSMLFFFFIAKRQLVHLYVISFIRIATRLILLHFVLVETTLTFRIGIAFVATEILITALMVGSMVWTTMRRPSSKIR